RHQQNDQRSQQCDPDAIADPRLRDALQQLLGRGVRFALADEGELRAAVARAFDLAPATAAADDAVAMLDELVLQAWLHRASDIHLEPDDSGYRVRLRIDGELRVLRSGIARSLGAALVSRLKVQARLDIAETRAPQDGSLVHRLASEDGRGIDIRVATAPTRLGERATLRILGADERPASFSDLGMMPGMERRIEGLLERPSGLLLLTGPTGCGKTTTLYAALRRLNRPGVNLMTVEDPVECLLPGISQMQVDDAGKLSFAGAMRSLLRHDPDVLMVGEIRDRETAEVALRASLTGHLVLSTLHTSTAAGAVTRLVDMGCEPYLVAATLAGVVSQRLVRRLCPHCRREVDGVWQAPGCLRCHDLGYAGRIALCELFVPGASARSAITAGAEIPAIEAAAEHFTAMADDARGKIAAGLTSLAEVRQQVEL
ncbi:MAG: type II/IV secretion system protein, partial [Planctomycetes bacterium]|nr:type II/IV secretion system protein [Planctomycetota bacterium]